MGIFKKKSDLTAGPDLPLDQVAAMKAQGYSNNQIIQTLQRDGYTSSQIFDAISQAEMSGTSAAPVPTTSPPQLNMPDVPMQPMQQADMQYNQQQMPMPPSYGSSSSSSNEEIIEAIIDEKWNELVRDINKVIEWKQKADSKLTAMEQQMNGLKDQFDKLHQAIIGKIGEYDKHMLDVGAELQAMEKVFSKVLPTFIENVNELNRITDRVKSNSSSSSPSISSKSKKQMDND